MMGSEGGWRAYGETSPSEPGEAAAWRREPYSSAQ